VADTTLLATLEQRTTYKDGYLNAVEINTTYKEEQAASLSEFAWTPLVSIYSLFSSSSVISANRFKCLVHSLGSVLCLTWSQLALNFRWRS
jgi:hypothetical protein